MPKRLTLLRLCQISTLWFIAGLSMATLRADSSARPASATASWAETTVTAASVPVAATLFDPPTYAALFGLAGLGLTIARRPIRRVA